MKSKKILCCLLAAMILTGTAGSFSTAVCADEEETSIVSEGQQVTADNTVFQWDRNSDSEITVQTDSASRIIAVRKNGAVLATSALSPYLSVSDGTVVMKKGLLKQLDDGENILTLVLKEGTLDITVNVINEPQDIAAAVTEFDWDKSSPLGISVETNSKSKTVSLYKDGELLVENENLKLYILAGKVGIASAVLKGLDEGKNHLTLVLDDGELDITVNVTDNKHMPKTITADNTVFEWDRSNPIGISVKTDSKSSKVSLYKDGELFAENENLKLYILAGKVGITSAVLQGLDEGENHLTLVLDDGEVDITVNVTDSRHTPKTITAQNTFFEWDKSDLLGIAVKTDSKSKTVSLYKDGELFAENEKLKLYILAGRVGIAAKILKQLDVGENVLTLMLDDGTLDITVHVTDSKNAGSDITADKTSFTWDRSDSSGISVATNSVSDTVQLRRSGRLFAEGDGKNLTINGGKVMISSDILGRLDNGKNELTLVLTDGTIDITVTVTDKNTSSSQTSNSNFSRSNSSSGNISVPDTGSVMSLPMICIASVIAAAGIPLLLKKRKKSR